MKLSEFIDFNILIERDKEFDSVCKISDCPPKGKYLIFIENEKFAKTAFTHIEDVVAIITTYDLKDNFINLDIGIACCDNPKLIFLKIANTISSMMNTYDTVIGRNVLISEKADIANEGVIIEDNVIIEDYVKIFSGVKVGKNSIIKHGALVGCNNYERCINEDGHTFEVEHKGILQLGQGVTVGEYAMIDKALFHWDSTIIEDYCFIGRGSDIAHGCKIGKEVVIAPQVQLCGNVIVGSKSKISVGSIISNRVKIGSEAIVSLGSVVNKDVESATRVTGNLAIPHDKFLRVLKCIIDKKE